MTGAQPSVTRPANPARLVNWNRSLYQNHSLVSFLSRSFPLTLVLNHRGNDLAYAALQLAIVGDWRTHGYVGSGDRRDTERDQLCGVNQQAGGNAFFQPVAAQVADLLADEHEIARRAFIDSAFSHHDLRL